MIEDVRPCVEPGPRDMAVDQTPVTPAQFAAAREFVRQFGRYTASGGGCEVTLSVQAGARGYDYRALDGWQGVDRAVDCVAADLANGARLIFSYPHNRGALTRR